MDELFGIGYVARHLGVEVVDVNRWLDKPTAHFPMPVAVIVQTAERSGTPVWSRAQLAALRDWLAARLGLNDPAAHWALIDAGDIPAVPQGQTELNLAL